MFESTLSELLSYTRDGEWGEGAPADGLVRVKVIRGTDFERVRFGDLSTLPTRYLRSDLLERKQLRAGDVLIETAGGTKDQPTGRTVLVDRATIEGAKEPLICASFARFLRADRNKVDPAYLFWKLQAEYRSGALFPYHIQHTGVARFQYTQFATSHRLSLHEPIASQEAVAAPLSAIDDKIELNRRMNETLEAMAQAIFRDWFVDFGPVRRKLAGTTDPVEIMGGVTTDRSHAQRLSNLFPQGLDDRGLAWELAPFLSVAKLISGGTPKTDEPSYWNGSIAWASAKDVSQCGETFLVETERSITQSGLEKSSTRIVPKYSTVVVARGATTGRFCMFGREIAMNQTCYGLESRTGTPFWLNCAFRDLVSALLQSAHGSVFDTITTATFENAKLARPSDGLLRSFEDLVQPLFEKILSNQDESQILGETRDYLLPRLMSGEIRVAEAEERLEAVA